MRSNAIVPYILIMVLGIIGIFFFSLKGVGDSKEIAKEREGGEEQVEVVDFEPESYAQRACISCHGENLEGLGNAPTLINTGLSAEQVADVLVNGQGTMPPGLVPADNVEEMAEWVANLK